MCVCIHISIYLPGLVTAVAVFRNANTIPFCLTTDLLLNVFVFMAARTPSIHVFLGRNTK